MSGTIPRRENRSVFDLARLDELSGVPDLFLIVSEQTMYCLMNLVNADITDPRRYATQLLNERYVPVESDDAEWVLYEEVRERVQLEVYEQPMDDFLETLENIADRVAPIETENLYDSSYTIITGLTALNSGPVPEGEVWRVSTSEYSFSGGTVGYVVHSIIIPSENDVYIEVRFSPTTGIWYINQPDCWLAAGQSIRATFNITTAPTTVQLRTHVEKYAARI